MQTSSSDVFRLIDQIMADEKWRSPERIFKEIALNGVQTCGCRESGCIHPTILTVHEWIRKTMIKGVELDMKEKFEGRYVYWRRKHALVSPENAC